MRYGHAKLNKVANSHQISSKRRNKPDDLLDTMGFYPTLVDGTFCVGWRPIRGTEPEINGKEVYDCDVDFMSAPKHLYRIPNITAEGQKKPNKDPLLVLPDQNGNQLVESGQIQTVENIISDPPEEEKLYYASFASGHPCTRCKNVDLAKQFKELVGYKLTIDCPETWTLTYPLDDTKKISINTRTDPGGGPCQTLTRVQSIDSDGKLQYEYAAVLWKWRETYQNPSIQAGTEAHARMETLQTELDGIFGDDRAVPMIVANRPDGGKGYLPVLFADETRLQQLHEVLLKMVADDVDFETDLQYFVDGPDISLSFIKM